MKSKDQIRQQANLKQLKAIEAGGADFCFGDPAALPLPLARLVALTAASPGVEGVFTGGLTAVVLKLRVGERHFAVKLARRPCLVRNVDGQTSFLNELQCHTEIATLRRGGAVFEGVVAPLYGSVKHGVVVTPWVDGGPVAAWDERKLAQVHRSGIALMKHGLFEWDFSPGNVLDDGQQTWLFDFGYMYRFDPLREFSSAGHGNDVPTFHLAERVETRNVFAWLLEVETQQGRAAALAQFAMAKRVALASYAEWQAWLEAGQAAPAVVERVAGLRATWARGLAEDLDTLYLAEGWRSHSLDLTDDLHGQSCTPRTLLRVDWLLRAADDSFEALHAGGMLAAADAALSRSGLVAAYRAKRTLAEGWQVP